MVVRYCCQLASSNGRYFHLSENHSYQCGLLIALANSLNPDQTWQTVLKLWWYSWKIFSKKDEFEKKNQQTIKSMKNYLARRVKYTNCKLNLGFIVGDLKYEPQHEISNNVVCATSNSSDQPAQTCNMIRAFASPLNILWVFSYWLNIIWSF